MDKPSTWCYVSIQVVILLQSLDIAQTTKCCDLYITKLKEIGCGEILCYTRICNKYHVEPRVNKYFILSFICLVFDAY